MPNIHPFFTHFPIALFTISLIFDALGLLLRDETFEKIGWWTLVAGVIGLLGSLVTGLLAKGSIASPLPASDTLDTHQQLAFLITILAVLCLLWRISARTRLPEKKVLYMVMLGTLVTITWLGASYGGQLVYKFGLGVRSVIP